MGPKAPRKQHPRPRPLPLQPHRGDYSVLGIGRAEEDEEALSDAADKVEQLEEEVERLQARVSVVERACTEIRH